MLEQLADNKQTQDPGIGSSFERPLDRLVGADGNFRVNRIGRQSRLRQQFAFLVTMNWGSFVLLLLAGFMLTTLFFAGLYMMAGVENIANAELATRKERFYSALFLSSQTLTTVGYGNYFPQAPITWAISMIEAMCGLISFGAIAAVIYARVARPTARLIFARKALIAPYKNGWSLQVRLANMRNALLMDLEARYMLVLADVDEQGERINYYNLKLELERIHFLPLTWTLVHHITPDSPLADLSLEDLRKHRAEVLVMVKGVDEVYAQNVHGRHSYRFDEITWGGRFNRAFKPAKRGGTDLFLRKVHDFTPVPAPERMPKE